MMIDHFRRVSNHLQSQLSYAFWNTHFSRLGERMLASVKLWLCEGGLTEKSISINDCIKADWYVIADLCLKVHQFLPINIGNGRLIFRRYEPTPIM